MSLPHLFSFNKALSWSSERADASLTANPSLDHLHNVAGDVDHIWLFEGRDVLVLKDLSKTSFSVSFVEVKSYFSYLQNISWILN